MKTIQSHPCNSTAATSTVPREPRRGTIMAWSVFGLVFAGLCTALVVNQCWISGIRLESQRCLDAAALAAGHSLLSDDLLRQRQFPVEWEWRQERSRRVAVQTAAAYRRLHHVPALPADNVQFVNSERSLSLPAAIRVAFGPPAAQTRIPLLFAGVTGISSAANGSRCVVAILNRPVALRPSSQVSIPMLPVILIDDDSVSASASWSQQIEEFRGADRWDWDPERHSVESGSDGLPELTLVVDWRTSSSDSELLPLRLNRNCTQEQMTARFERGLAVSDMAESGLEEIAFPAPSGHDPDFCCDVYPLLTGIIGKARIVCLAKRSQSSTAAAFETTRPVAARVLDVRRNSQGAAVVTLQPCVMSTVTARMDAAGQPNRYIHHVRLRQ